MRCEAHESKRIISVTDGGIFISADDKEKVFSKFYRVTGKDQNKSSGFGIGFSLTADIIELHQGENGVQSELGKEPTFWFSLPLFNGTSF